MGSTPHDGRKLCHGLLTPTVLSMPALKLSHACQPALVCCREDVSAGMFTADPPHKQGLAAAYGFGPEDVEKTGDGKVRGITSRFCLLRFRARGC